jgi:hypothetical protein
MCIFANFIFVYNVLHTYDDPYRTVFRLRLTNSMSYLAVLSAVYNIVNLVSGGTNLYLSCGSEFVHIALPRISVFSGVMLLGRWINSSRSFDPLSSLGLLVL